MCVFTRCSDHGGDSTYSRETKLDLSIAAIDLWQTTAPVAMHLIEGGASERSQKNGANSTMKCNTKAKKSSA